MSSEEFADTIINLIDYTTHNGPSHPTRDCRIAFDSHGDTILKALLSHGLYDGVAAYYVI